MIDIISYINNIDSKKVYIGENGYDEEKIKHEALKSAMLLIINNELTKKQSLCLKLFYINGLSQPQIARKLGLSQPTVSRHITLAKKTVNKYLSYCCIIANRVASDFEKYSFMLSDDTKSAIL